MSSAIDRLARLNVPRYTSYPTAAAFSTDVSSDQQSAWLRAMPADTPASVYLHVPFCRTLCHYCGCNTKALRRDDVLTSYRHALECEIERVAGVLTGRPKIRRLHWGGGTPSILGVDGIAAVVATLRRHFGLDELREHAIELDPRFVTRDLAQGLADQGIDRVSLGVQDLDPAVQEAIGRRQPQEIVETAVTLLRAAGLSRINFDLIYGLPRQTLNSLEATCEAVATLRPNRIAYYGYAHVPRLRAQQRLIDVAQLPSSEERIAQTRLVEEVMDRRGYLKIGIDHFAVPDDALAVAARTNRLRRNFQGYTDDGEDVLLGFGASAISNLPMGYVQNESDPQRYISAMCDGRLAGVRGIHVQAHDRTRARIIESLMCDYRADLTPLRSDTSFDAQLEVLDTLAGEGLIDIEGAVVKATAIGRPLIRVIASAFDTYSSQSLRQFSLAV